MLERLRTWRRSVVVILTLMSASGNSIGLLASDGCIAQGAQMQAFRSGGYGYIDLAGKVHVQYCFSGSGYSSEVENLARAAISDWNTYQSETDTEFDEDCGNPDITFGSTGDDHDCGAYNTSTDQIHMSTNMQAAISGSIHNNDIGLWVFEHELGHVLGLNEAGQDPNTVMRNLPAVPGGSSCADNVAAFNPIPPPLTHDTATAARPCIDLARSDNYSNDDDVDKVPGEDGCEDWYLIVYVVYCANGGCTIVSSSTTYLGPHCI